MNQSVELSNAEIYDQRFVPAVFAQWGIEMTRLTGIKSGHSVLDVACGTGAFACAASTVVGDNGRVTGLDCNNEMLKVARLKTATVDWQEGLAESLPFPDNSFDIVGSQFGFMFFDDPVIALGEMMRVLRPGGSMAVAVCDAIDHSPGYAVLTELLNRLFGNSVAESFRAPFKLGSPNLLNQFCRKARLNNATVVRREGKVKFSSIKALVSTERACAWTLGGVLTNSQFDELLENAEESLKPFVQKDKQICFDMPALIIQARKA